MSFSAIIMGIIGFVFLVGGLLYGIVKMKKDHIDEKEIIADAFIEK